MISSKLQDKLIHFLYIAFFISLAGAFRAVTSVSIGLLLLTNILINTKHTGKFFSNSLKNNFLLACCIYYFLQVALMVSSPGHEGMARHIQIKSSIVFVPLAICCSTYLNPVLYIQLMRYFIWAMAGSLLVCLLLAVWKFYVLSSGPTVFFYHDLVSPFRHHAIHVSILLFIAIVHLLETARKGIHLYNNRGVHFLLVFYFMSCILLLSSKLVIFFTMLTAVYYLALHLKKTKFRIGGLMVLFAGLALIVVVLVTNNAISKRFREIFHTDLSLIDQKTFDPGIYFDGLQFRLLQWRFVKEILNENDAWLTGVSGDAQRMLDAKYISTHMYLGNGTAADRGYLDYNTHNEFLESLLQSGVPGLIAFSLVVACMIQLLWRRPGHEMLFVVAILLAYSLNESLLQRQYSITIFTFFPLFIYFSTQKPGADVKQPPVI